MRAIDDIDPLLTSVVRMYTTLSRQNRSMALDEFDAHQPSQQRMLEVRLNWPRPECENHDVWGRPVERRRRPQRAQQMARIVADRPHPVRGEQVRNTRAMVRRFSITYDTPGRRAQVVLQHPELAVLVGE